MLLALRSYQKIQAWHQADACCSTGSVKNSGGSKNNPNINTTLPESGVGYRTYNREENGVDQVGLPEMIAFIQRLGVEWDKESSELPFQVGDISRAGGGDFPPHEAHKNGTEADLRPFRKDGAMEPTNINDPSYDRDKTRQWCQLVKRLDPGATILFNDSQLIKEGLTRYYKGHHNHLHLRPTLNSDQLDEIGC
ncbi:MAG: penicillin-insensitive murein endopeptidase [Vulcanimicrobiota bacterium]